MILFIAFDFFPGCDSGDLSDLIAQAFEQASHNQPCMRGAEAEVGAETESDMGVRFAIKTYFIG